MENIDKDNRLVVDIKAKESMLKADYEYVLNREKRITKEKEVLLNKLIKLKAILEEVR
tara:strand:+ start:155 stop:328 length:174 start_codon:yes stop_codon:yes gene_type:complete